MKIYTSYFGAAKKLPKELTQISICLHPPRGYYGLEYRRLAPTFDILEAWKRCPVEEDYVRNYNAKVLDKLNPETVYHQLEVLTDGNDCVLLCYEVPSDFCHRHLVADWFKKAGYDVEEINVKKGKK